MKACRLFLILLLGLWGLPLRAQPAPRPQAFLAATDSLQQRLKRRTGVECKFRLEKVTPRSKTLDFYYSQNLSGYPWRPGDVSWFIGQLRELAADALGGYAVGDIFAKRQNLMDLPLPALTSDGKPLPNAFRTEDPFRRIPPLVSGDDFWPLGLSGRHIALWQSHGRYWEESTGRWEWQRSALHRTVEDLYTQAYVVPLLMPMLERAGAVVLTPRERDPQVHEVVCDNDPAFSGRSGSLRRAGTYAEEGFWRDAGPGFADTKAAYSDDDNPFTLGTSRMSETSMSEQAGHAQAQALWRPDIPERGEYAVYVSYRSVPGSTTDAQYTVRHLGGETLLHVNQRIGGGTWVYLGTFPFDKGTGGFVRLSNHSSVSGVVTADAVRFGGGMGKVARDGTTSGLPSYVEGALYNFQYSGLDMHLLDEWEGDYKKDLSARGIWVNELAEQRGVPLDLSLAFHSDAGTTPNDSIVGTLVIHTLRSEGKEVLPDGESRLTSRLMADMVQTQVVEDIRALFEPAWTRRETLDRSYSESRVPRVPAVILELLSHQNFADMRYGQDPTFRFSVARSVYKGILKYLSARYGVPYAVQPLPVHSFRARLEGGKAYLSWKPSPDPLEPTAVPQYYKVYTRRDDGAFNRGFQIKDESCVIQLEAGHVYSFRISACNEGGESIGSEILAVGVPSSGEGKKVLVVNNFTRLSSPSWFDTPQYAGFNDHLDSGVPLWYDLHFSGSVNEFDRSRAWTDDDNPGFGGSFTDQGGKRVAGNSFDFVALHGKAILDAGYAFESSSSAAFDGRSDAFALDLICGKQLTTRVGRGAVEDRYCVFPASLQEAVRRFTAQGGNVLVSGSYIATDVWDRVFPGVKAAPEESRKFVSEVLGYRWVTNYGDYSGLAAPVKGCRLPTVHYNREWSPRMYRVENPDGLLPAGSGSRPLLRYGGTNITAATFFDAGTYRTAAFGIPLETSPQMPDVIREVLRLFDEPR